MVVVLFGDSPVSASFALASLCVCLVQELPSTPLPNDPVAIEQRSDEPSVPSEAPSPLAPLEARAEAAGLLPALPQGPSGTEAPIRPVADDETFVRSLEEQIRRDNPELSDASVREMAMGIAEMRRRLSRQSPLGPVLEVPTAPMTGPQPSISGFGPGAVSSSFGHSLPANAPNGPAPHLAAIDHSNPDQFFVNALRMAARQLDEAAAVLEDRAAYDLADQMRDQAKKLRDEARSRAATLMPSERH